MSNAAGNRYKIRRGCAESPCQPNTVYLISLSTERTGHGRRVCCIPRAYKPPIVCPRRTQGSVGLCGLAPFSDRCPQVSFHHMGLRERVAATCAILLVGFARLTAVDAQTAASAASSAEAPSPATFQALINPTLFTGARARSPPRVGTLLCAPYAQLQGRTVASIFCAGLEATLAGQFTTLKDEFGSEIASQLAGLTSAASNLNFGAHRPSPPHAVIAD